MVALCCYFRCVKARVVLGHSSFCWWANAISRVVYVSASLGAFVALTSLLWGILDHKVIGHPTKSWDKRRRTLSIGHRCPTPMKMGPRAALWAMKSPFRHHCVPASSRGEQPQVGLCSIGPSAHVCASLQVWGVRETPPPAISMTQGRRWPPTKGGGGG